MEGTEEVLASHSDDRPSDCDFADLAPNGLCLLEVDEDHEVGGVLDSSQVDDHNMLSGHKVVEVHLWDILVHLEKRVGVQSCSQFPGVVVLDAFHLLHTLAYSSSQVPLGFHHGIQLVLQIQLGRLEEAAEGGQCEGDYVVGGQFVVEFVKIGRSRYAQWDQLEALSPGVWYQGQPHGEGLCY